MNEVSEHSEAEEVLRDGRRVRLRPIHASDAVRIEQFWRRLDRDAQRRFLELAGVAEREIGSVAAPSMTARGLVASTGRDGERLLGLAHFTQKGPDVAEFLVFVEAAARGVGLGTILVRHLAEAAKRAGIREMTGNVHVDETRMLNLLEAAGLRYRRHDQGRTVHATFDVQDTDSYLDAVLRDRTEGAVAVLDRFLRPRAIAVVGASSDPETISGLLFANLLSSGFAGPVFPVNPTHTTVQGVKSYPDLATCPSVPDLVVVCVPAPIVPDIVAQAGAVGVRAVCVVSAGFAETGSEGRALQDELSDVALAGGVRLVGPNCMGLLNGAADVRFNATFSRAFPPPGRIALLTQSGAVGLAALEQADVRGLGIGGFVSIGNSADVAGNDVLLYWGQDPDTDVILLYLESVGDPRWFARIARRVARHVPVVAVKAGRSSAGSRAAASHTAALAAGDVAVDALFRQAGVIRTDTMEELFDVATVLGSQAPPAGRRVAILTNGGGPGILAADACEASGLLVPQLSEDTAAQLRAFLAPEASVANPVDMVAGATAEQYAAAVRVLGAAEEIDALIVVFVPPMLTRADDVARELIEARAEFEDDLPLLAVFMNREGAPLSLNAAGIPSFTFPENAAKALGRIAQWEEWRRQPPGNVLRPKVDTDAARNVIAATDGRGDGWLTSQESEALLHAYGVPTVRVREVRTPAEAAAAQSELGSAVVVKIAAPIHKRDVGGVRLDIRTPEAAADAVETIRADLQSAGLGEVAQAFLVQEQIESGLEMIVGVNHDAIFGPLVMVGLGGGLVEVLGDVVVRITPLTDRDVDEMLRSLKSYRLLTGYRGAPALDIDALRDVLHRISALVEDLPEVVELDLNPIFVREHGAVAADVRVRVTNATPG